MSLALCVLSPSVAHAQQRGGLPAPKEIVMPDHATELVMHRYEKLPVIELMINGDGPFRMVLDTGAGAFLLSDRLTDTLDLPAPPGMQAGMQVQVMSPGGPISATLGYIDELRIGDIQVKGAWTISTELPFGESIDGVIGIDFFRDELLTYDYLNNRVVIRDGELPEVNGQDIFSYESASGRGNHPTIEMIAGEMPTAFLIDTGYRGWFMVPAEWVNDQEILAGPVEGQMGLSAGGPVMMQSARVATPISLGQYSVSAPIVRIQEDGSSSMPRYIVGTSFLEHFAVTFDGSNSRVQFAHGPEGAITAPALRYVGMGMKQVGEQLEVWAVHPKSHAKEIGISVGDLVYTINGISAAEFYRSHKGQKLLTSTETITVTYAPRGSVETREVELRTLELLPASE